MENEKELVRKQLIDNIEKVNIPTMGGQHTNGPQSSRIILVLKELEFKVEIGIYRSQIKNFEKAMLLMELFIDDYLNEIYKS